MPGRISVASTDFVRNVGVWQEQALLAPVHITYHGRDRLVLISAERYGAIGAVRLQASPELGALPTTFAMENVTEAFVALSPELNVVLANRPAELYFGMSRSELEGVSLSALFPMLAGSVFLTQVRRVVRNREASAFAAELSPSEGQRLEFKVFPLAQGVGLLFANVAERDRREHALADAEAIHAAIGATPEISLLKCDGRGRLTEIDEKFATWTRFDRDVLVGCRLFDLVAVADRRTLGDRFEDCLVSGRASTTVVRITAKDLEERAMRLSLSAMNGRQAAKVRILCHHAAAAAALQR